MRNSILASANQSPLLASQAAAILGGNAFNQSAAAAGLFGPQSAALLNSAAAANLSKFGAVTSPGGGSGVGDIDLTLPITTTYLKRMRALGLAAGFDQNYRQMNNDSVRANGQIFLCLK